MRGYEALGLAVGAVLAAVIMAIMLLAATAALGFSEPTLEGVDLSRLKDPYGRTCRALETRLGAGRCVASTDGRILYFSPSGKYLGFGEVR